MKKRCQNQREKSYFILIFLILLQVSYITLVPINTARSKVVSQNHDPILFLHGWTRKSTDWNTMKEWFSADGWSNLYAWTFSDFMNCSITANINNANKIKEWVNYILNMTGVEKVDLIGHSMGGVSSRYYIKFLGGIDTVDDYVSLGCPHVIDTCIYEDIGPLYLSLNDGDKTPGGILNDTKEEDHIPGNISYTSIYSYSDVTVRPPQSILDGANNTMVTGLSHASLLTNKTVYELVRTAVNGEISKGSNAGYDGLAIPTVILIISSLAIKKKWKE